MSTHILEVPDGKIACDDIGRGPLVICVPSMGDLRGEYRFLAPRLAEAGFRVISLDVRGHGESSVRWPVYDVGAIGQDILALLRLLDGGQAVLVGTSMAAGAAVWTAAEAPGLVRGLVLIGPAVRGSVDWLTRWLLSPLFARPWGPSLWVRYYAGLYPTQKPPDFAAYRAALGANLKEPGRIEAFYQMAVASKAASEQRLSRVAAPSLVLMGSKDPDFKRPETEARWVADHLRGSYEMIWDAGHYPHAEMPDKTAALILSFLKGLWVPPTPVPAASPALK